MHHGSLAWIIFIINEIGKLQLLETTYFPHTFLNDDDNVELCKMCMLISHALDKKQTLSSSCIMQSVFVQISHSFVQ
jgi:hypothetical protein